MSVNTEKGVAHCFACGFGGGALKLIQAMEGCDRQDAERRAEEILKAAGLEVKTAARSRYQRPGEGRISTPKTRYVPPGRRSA
jgi:DNA primase